MDFQNNYDVALVGYGPTGATLANLLIKLNLKVLVIEREAAVLQLPRAIRFDAECMRVFQTIGITKQLLRDIMPAPGMKFKDADDNLLFAWERPMSKGMHQWSSAYRIHQPDLEAVLRENIKDHALLDLKLRHDVFKINENEQNCTLYYEDLSNGTLHQATAKYVVGCDGARSLVRRLIETTFEDLNLHSKWLVVDFIAQNDERDLGDYSIQFCDPIRPMSYIKGTGQRRRWEIMVKPEDDVQHLASAERIWSLLEKYIRPEDAKIERSAIYTFHALIAKKWCKGRLIIAGDAAHQTPPFMGQGMAAGIRDAANLAWKINEAIRHQNSALIESYYSERVSHVQEFIHGAISFGKIIQNYAKDAEYQRQVAQLKNFITPTPGLGEGFYDASDQINGHIAPQFILDGNVLSDEVVGYQYALFIQPEFKHLIAELNLDQIDRLKVIQADQVESLQWLTQNQSIAILVRPDRYIFAKATDRENLEQLLKAAYLHEIVCSSVTT